MIPLQLELKNFMSYGEDVPALDFSGMHMLCLSGENGNGKSALLDAMTWALWGESRVGKYKHEELIRKGADEMSVTFTFEMDGQVYRVLRKRSKRSGGQHWELQQQTPDQGLGAGWRALTGNNSGETEKAIQKLLRMSYDTFINSAYLRQGQADQFVRQTAGKRKEILADILDLSRYDQLEGKARDRAREAGAEATDLEREINGIDAQLSTEDEHRERIATLRSRAEELQAQYEGLKAEIYAVRDRKKELEGQQEFATRLREQAATLDREMADLSAQIAQHEAEAGQWKALLDRRDEICRDHERLLAARGRLETLDQSLKQWYKGRDLLAQAEKEWIQAENLVRRDAQKAAYEHDDAQLRVRELPDVQTRHEAIAARVAALDARAAERETLAARLLDLKDAFGRLEQDSKYLSARVTEWEERLQALNSQGGTCSVCNSALPADKVAGVRAEYEAQRDDCLTERKRVRAEGNSAKDEMTALEARLRALDGELRAGQQDQQHLGQLSQQRLEFEAVQQNLPNLLQVREAAERIVREGDFAPELRARIEKYTQALDRLATVEADHAAVKSELAKLADAERLHLQLGQAQTQFQTAESYLSRARQGLQQRQDARTAFQGQLASLSDVTLELGRLLQRDEDIRSREAVRRAEDQRVQQEIGSREKALELCASLRLERVDKQKRCIGAQREKEVHEQLAKAFGKKGVQALIIENAIPELQEEANRLLERLTDGDMRMFFETLKDSKAKKDSPIETLEIKVEDSSGPRPLEMYSGGESFRAAFALRIALSKLLARRAGARLQTLIIDEGFGTQDGKGREKLVDALNAIAGDFERIIVISHIDELKDAFSTRIEITKTPSGSQITVMEGAAG